MGGLFYLFVMLVFFQVFAYLVCLQEHLLLVCCQDAYLTICILASEDQLYFPASSLLAGSFFIPAVIIRPRCASQGNDAAA